MTVNNTARAKLFALYPGDEILMVFDEYPYNAPKPIMINPETGSLWVKLKIMAKKKEWNVLDHHYTSKLLINY